MILRALFLAVVLLFAPDVGAGGGDFEQKQMKKVEPDNNIQIKVALIGLAGTIGAAYFISKKRK